MAVMRLTMYLTEVKGQGLAEYSLIGILVLAVSIPAVSLFGDEFMGLLGGIFSGMNQSVTAQAAPLSAAALAQSGDQLASRNSFTGGAADVKVTLKDGTVINLSQYPQDLKKYVEATGSNGATNELLAQLDSLVEQLKKGNKISESQLNSLQALSNQGHRMASIEKLLEDSYKNASSLNTIYSGQIVFEGKTYTPLSLRSLLGWDSGLNGNYTGLDTPDTLKTTMSAAGANPELASFLNLYFQAEGSGALNDPVVKGIVSDLSSQISYLSEVAEHSSWQVATDSLDPKTISSVQVSHLTDDKSSKICKVGNGKDTGVHCQ